MMFAVSVLSLVALFASAKPASATTRAGDLKVYCETAEENHTKGTLTAENGFCMGYIAGFLQMVDSKPIFRIDGKYYVLTTARGITTGDAVITFANYMKAHPEKANDDPANVILLEVFFEAKVIAITPVVEDSQIQ